MADISITGDTQSASKALENLGLSTLNSVEALAVLNAALEALNSTPDVNKKVDVKTTGYEQLVKAAQDFAASQLQTNEALIGFEAAAIKSNKAKDEAIVKFRALTTQGNQVAVTTKLVNNEIVKQGAVIIGESREWGLLTEAQKRTAIEQDKLSMSYAKSLGLISQFETNISNAKVALQQFNSAYSATNAAPDIFRDLAAKARLQPMAPQMGLAGAGEKTIQPPVGGLSPGWALQVRAYEAQKQQIIQLSKALGVLGPEQLKVNKATASYTEIIRGELPIVKELTAAEIKAVETWYKASIALGQNNAQRAMAANSVWAYSNALKGSIPTINQIEQAELRHQVALERSTSAANAAWKFWLRFAVAQTVHRAIYALLRNIKEGIKATADLEKKISEVRTVSQGPKQLPFQGWLEGAKKLSDTFGATIEDVTEGLYQAISNQIAKGAEAFIFLENSLKFSRAAVTDTENSVNLLSSALNAYSLGVENSTEVSASLFKLIELGRVRADEIADSYGRVAVVAKQAGIGLDELNAILATLTIQGKKPAVAMTEVRNVMLKLIDPTEEMQKLFDKWGVGTGIMAIRTFGFAGVIKKLNEEFLILESQGIGKGTQALSDMFNSIRALSGILGVTGDKSKQFTEIMDGFKTKTQDYERAVSIGVESIGKRLQIQLQQVRNYFITTFGQGTLALVTGFLRALQEQFGIMPTLLNVTKGFLEVIKASVLAYASYTIALRIATAQDDALVTLIKLKVGWHTKEIASLGRLAAAESLKGNVQAAAYYKEIALLKEKQAALAAIRFEQAAVTLGITVLVGAIIYGFSKAIGYIKDTEIEYQKLLGGIKETTEVEVKFAKATDEIANSAKAATDALDAMNRSVLELGASKIATLKEDIEKLKEGIEKSQENVKNYLDEAISILQDRVRLITDNIKTIVNKIKESETVIVNISKGTYQQSFYDNIINNIGKINEGWREARKRLIAYVLTLETKGKFIYPEPGQKPTEMQVFARQFEVFKNYFSILQSGFKEAINTSNLEFARDLFGRILAQTEKLHEFGFSYNEILKYRNKLLIDYANLEKKIITDQQKKKAFAEKVNELAKQQVELAKSYRDELNSIKFTDKGMEESIKAYQKVLGKIGTLITEAGSPELIAQINAVIEPKKTEVQTELMLKRLSDITTGPIKSVDDLTSEVKSQLGKIEQYLQKQLLLQQLETNLASLTKETDRAKAEIETRASKQQALNIEQQKLEKGITEAITEGLNKADVEITVVGEPIAIAGFEAGESGYTREIETKTFNEKFGQSLKEFTSANDKTQQQLITDLQNLLKSGLVKGEQKSSLENLIKALVLYIAPTKEIREMVEAQGESELSLNILNQSVSNIKDNINELIKKPVIVTTKSEKKAETGGQVTETGSYLANATVELTSQQSRLQAEIAKTKEAVRDIDSTIKGSTLKTSSLNETMNKFLTKETEPTVLNKGLPGLGGLGTRDIFKTFELQKLGGKDITAGMYDFVKKSTKSRLPWFIGPEQGVFAPGARQPWEETIRGEGGRVKAIDPYSTPWMPPATYEKPPVTEINNVIDIYIDGEKVESVVTARQTRKSIRGSIDLQTKPRAINPQSVEQELYTHPMTQQAASRGRFFE